VWGASAEAQWDPGRCPVGAASTSLSHPGSRQNTCSITHLPLYLPLPLYLRLLLRLFRCLLPLPAPHRCLLPLLPMLPLPPYRRSIPSTSTSSRSGSAGLPRGSLQGRASSC